MKPRYSTIRELLTHSNEPEMDTSSLNGHEKEPSSNEATSSLNSTLLEYNPSESSSAITYPERENLTQTLDHYAARRTDEQAYLRKKRQLEIDSEEIAHKHKRMILQIQEGIVQSVLEDNFAKAEKLRNFMKTLALTFNPSSKPSKQQPEVIEISDDEERDVKVVFEKLSTAPTPALALPTYPARPAERAVPNRQQNLNLPINELVVHVVATADATIPDDNQLVKVIYKAKTECGRFGFIRDCACALMNEHVHYICYLADGIPRTRDNYMIYLNRVLKYNFGMTLPRRNTVMHSPEHVRKLVEVLESRKSSHA
jgi:hypothetical protein